MERLFTQKIRRARVKASFPLYVVIATHERPDLLKRTLDSLAKCTLPEGYQSTIVVENGSKAGAEEIVNAHAQTLNARYLYTPRGNKSHALNVALQEIENGLVLFTDDDVRLHPEVLVRYAEAAKGVDEGVYFGGPTDVDHEKEPPNWLVSSLPHSAVGWNRDSEWEYALGFNWAAFAPDLKRLDGFDEDRGPGTGTVGQETDMQQRLVEAGVEMRFVPGGLVWHYVPEERCNPWWLLRRYYRMGKGSVEEGWEVSGRWFGFNSWVWVELGRRVARAVRTVWDSDRETRFKAKRRLAYFLGKMQGFREFNR